MASRKSHKLNKYDINLDKLFGGLRSGDEEDCNEEIQKILNSNLTNFKKTFEKLSRSIKNSLYEDKLIKKFKDTILDRLSRLISNL